jgi:hypothetical protein
MIKNPKCWIKHIADAPVDVKARGHPFARDFDKLARDINRDDIGPAFGRLNRKRTSPAACIKNPPSGQISGQPVKQCAAHFIAPGAHRRTDFADRRIRSKLCPCGKRSPVEISFEAAAISVV